MRKAFTAVAIAAVAGLALPAQAMADPAAPPAPESVPIEFLASFAPAIIGAPQVRPMLQADRSKRCSTRLARS